MRVDRKSASGSADFRTGFVRRVRPVAAISTTRTGGRFILELPLQQNYSPHKLGQINTFVGPSYRRLTKALSLSILLATFLISSKFKDNTFCIHDPGPEAVRFGRIKVHLRLLGFRRGLLFVGLRTG